MDNPIYYDHRQNYQDLTVLFGAMPCSWKNTFPQNKSQLNDENLLMMMQM
jgi:hypothetical protein